VPVVSDVCMFVCPLYAVCCVCCVLSVVSVVCVVSMLCLLCVVCVGVCCVWVLRAFCVVFVCL